LDVRRCGVKVATEVLTVGAIKAIVLIDPNERLLLRLLILLLLLQLIIEGNSIISRQGVLTPGTRASDVSLDSPGTVRAPPSVMGAPLLLMLVALVVLVLLCYAVVAAAAAVGAVPVPSTAVARRHHVRRLRRCREVHGRRRLSRRGAATILIRL
jgi:hypothetical protein